MPTPMAPPNDGPSGRREWINATRARVTQVAARTSSLSMGARVHVDRQQQRDRGDQAEPPRLRVQRLHDVPASGDRDQTEPCADDPDPRDDRLGVLASEHPAEGRTDPVEERRMRRGPVRGRIRQLPAIQQQRDVLPICGRVEAFADGVVEGVVPPQHDREHGHAQAREGPAVRTRGRCRHAVDASPGASAVRFGDRLFRGSQQARRTG